MSSVLGSCIFMSFRISRAVRGDEAGTPQRGEVRVDGRGVPLQMIVEALGECSKIVAGGGGRGRKRAGRRPALRRDFAVQGGGVAEIRRDLRIARLGEDRAEAAFIKPENRPLLKTRPAIRALTVS